MKKRTFGITKFRVLVFGLVFCSLATIGLLMDAPKASADICSVNGRNCGVGFFSGSGSVFSGHNLYGPPPGPGLQVNNALDMINTLGARVSCNGINSPTAKLGPPQNDQNASSAAFTMITMMGMPPGTPKNAACQNWSKWRTLVETYNTLGLIHFNEMHNSGGINTLFTFNWNSDVVYYNDSVISNSIVIYSPTGAVLYAIKKDCGNPVGHLQGLTSIVGTPSCGGYTITPGLIDPQTAYNIKASVVYNSSAAATLVRTSPGTKFYLKVSGPGVNYNNASVTPITQSGSSLKISVNMGPTGNTGTYIVSWGLTGPYGSANCGGNGTIPGPGGPLNPPATFGVADQPYFDVTGGDVAAGSGMSAGGVDCAVVADTKAGIVSWNRRAAGAYGGAGTKYAALALNHLQDFATGQGSGFAPSGLAFANTVDGQINTGNGLFGGMFDSLPCVKDYYGTKPASAKDISLLTDTVGLVGSFYSSGPTNIVGNSNIKAANRLTIYIDGDAYISGDIKFSGAYAKVADIPSVKIIVRGNIYIAPGVTQLDGMYIAQPTTATSGDGNIYTCATNVGSPALHPYQAVPLNGGLYSACKTQLTVNGAFIANQVWLLRTAGSISGLSAETFNFTPEVWLTAPYDSSVSGSSSGKYDAITSLPPVL